MRVTGGSLETTDRWSLAALLAACLGLALALQSCGGCEGSSDPASPDSTAPSALQRVEPLPPPQDRIILPMHSYPRSYKKESPDEMAD
ncbi:MAG: hypothetical protein HYY13_13365 [Nitrospirae bacterium]|nr:hypothetical protein [Nitrospirota bacterium]